MTHKDSEEILEELKRSSRSRHPKNVNTSTVDRLIDSHWCSKEDLVLAYTDLQTPDLDRVIVFSNFLFRCDCPTNG